ncbi:MAG: hypothetical protein C4584_01190 [Armatimonadetes bacterium]|nr:MAG: hypothetical protein C4584_01190 [Armatimonadota bacterium]
MNPNGDRNVFLIIDGNAIMHRAYHAIPNFSTSTGIPTGAVYGFFSMLLKLFQEIKPSYLAITFDRPKPTFRQALFVGYQAQRPKMDDGLAGQIKNVHSILEKAVICVYEVDGFEADDVIGSIADQVQSSKFKVQSLETIIVSGDRDLLQLVNSSTKILAPVLGISKMVLFDEERVMKNYNLEPGQIVDYKALAGDSSDNYSGVPGVGPKTASKLIKQYGTIENMYQNIDKIKVENEGLAQKLLNGSEMAILAKKLAAIDKNVPFSFNMDDCKVENIEKDGFKNAFFEFELMSLSKRIDGIFGAKVSGEKKKRVQMELL